MSVQLVDGARYLDVLADLVDAQQFGCYWHRVTEVIEHCRLVAFSEGYPLASAAEIETYRAVGWLVHAVIEKKVQLPLCSVALRATAADIRRRNQVA